MVLIAVLLVVILTVSLFIVQNTSKSSPTPTPSPVPTEISPTPTGTTSPIPTTPTPPSQTPTPTSVPTPFLYPGEVTQYQGQDLTPITDFIEDLVQHPDVSIAGTQNINQTTYSLTITGLINKTLEYTYDDVVNNFQSYPQVVTLTCVEGWSVTMLWQGVLVNDLLKEAGVSSNATTLIFSASDGYTTALPLDYVVQNSITLAYKMNNVTLTPQTGWPLMLVAQNQYGYKWIMWVTGIDVSNDSSYLGYWESRGYPNDATLSDSNNAALHSDNVPVAEAIVVSAAGTVIAAVIYTTLVKPSTKQPKTREPPKVRLRRLLLGQQDKVSPRKNAGKR